MPDGISCVGTAVTITTTTLIISYDDLVDLGLVGNNVGGTGGTEGPTGIPTPTSVPSASPSHAPVTGTPTAVPTGSPTRVVCRPGWVLFERSCYFYESTLLNSPQAEIECTVQGASHHVSGPHTRSRRRSPSRLRSFCLSTMLIACICPPIDPPPFVRSSLISYHALLPPLPRPSTGAHLARVGSATENAFLRDLTTPDSEAWIGLKRVYGVAPSNYGKTLDTAWGWEWYGDETALSYERWAPGEPRALDWDAIVGSNSAQTTGLEFDFFDSTMLCVALAHHGGRAPSDGRWVADSCALGRRASICRLDADAAALDELNIATLATASVYNVSKTLSPTPQPTSDGIAAPTMKPTYIDGTAPHRIVSLDGVVTLHGISLADWEAADAAAFALHDALRAALSAASRADVEHTAGALHPGGTQFLTTTRIDAVQFYWVEVVVQGDVAQSATRISELVVGTSPPDASMVADAAIRVFFSADLSLLQQQYARAILIQMQHNLAHGQIGTEIVREAMQVRVHDVVLRAPTPTLV